MRWWLIILLLLLVGFIAIQFFQPAKNSNRNDTNADLAEVYAVPRDIHNLLKAACYDCHSNSTNYPWYSRIQPFGWILARHIRKGKEELNFNEFATLSVRRQISKLNGLVNSIKDGSMPLKSYKFLHADARLSEEEKNLIIHWATMLKDSLRSKKL